MANTQVISRSNAAKMKSAWVITQEGTRSPREVGGILSARKSSKTIKDYLEWLYALLHYGPSEHLACARYTNPQNPYKAELHKTNTNVPVQDAMHCGDNPYLEACLAKDVNLIDADGEQPVLQWTHPGMPICDKTTGHVIDRIPGQTYRAPVRLPLHIHRDV
jgi:hypothetical protein